MGRRPTTAVLLCVAVAALFPGCGEGPSAKRDGPTPAALVEAYFLDELVQCTSDTECVTGTCDLTFTYTLNLSAGYCIAFPSATERWHRQALAQRLAGAARGDVAVYEAVMRRVAQELGRVRRAAEKEALYLLLGELGDERALALLRDWRAREEGPIRQLAGLILANAGDDAGLDDVVEAGLSSVVRVRVHAAHAAGGLCNTTSQGVLAELLQDSHPMVRDAAAAAVSRCSDPAAGKLLDGIPGFAAERARRTVGQGP